MMAKLQTLLRHHEPPLDQEVQEYLESILDEIDDSSFDKKNDEHEHISSILEQFLNPTTCESILALLGSPTEPKTDIEEGKEDPSSQSKLQTFSGQSLGGPLQVSSMESPETPTEPNLDKNESEKRESPKKGATRTKRREKHHNRHTKSKLDPTKPSQHSELVDDHASAWKERQETGQLWGGRGHGGRGVRYTGENYDNLHLPSVSLQFEGNELLVDSPMNIVRGHRYGLLGRNGVGKSTLLRQLAQHAIPGIPHGMQIILVRQQIQGRDDQTALEALLEADADRSTLLTEMEQVESAIEQGLMLEDNAQRLDEIVAELDAIDADNAEDRAMGILQGLSFTTAMIEGPTSALSGGWRMRLALAQALFVPYADLILLDECTNHLDLQGMDWLIEYLTKNPKNHERALMVVSHDRMFLDAICTDIVVMEHQRLTYHVGSYSEYQLQMQEKAAREAQILDASERQRSKAMAFVQKQQNNKKSTDPNKQRQAKMIREKKLDRIGNYREDGKRYKTNSLKKLDESYVRLAQKVHIERDEAVLKLSFPNPTWPPGAPEGSPLVQMENVSFAYGSNKHPLLTNLTLNISRGSKIALVGKNGSGKTTLIKLLTGELDDLGAMTGSLWRHPSLRFGHVTQYSVEELEAYSEMTVVEYAKENLTSGRASSTVIRAASGNVRQYLGGFGLGGAHALRPIGTLSGGERMRLCFATVLADQPHVLFLDESTNHVDLETLDSMSAALRDYQGTVLMVSHNQGFLAGFCKELWVLENGKVDVGRNDTESFDELFSNYRHHSLSTDASSGRQQGRRLKSNLAKQATKQSKGTAKGTTLFA